MSETVDIGTKEDMQFGVLSESLGFLLRLSQLVAFQDFYARFGASDMRPGEISVLLLIDENPGMRQGALARRLLIKRAHMTKMVQAFETAGLVKKTVPEDDKRGIELHLTAEGRRRVDQIKPVFAEYEGVTRHGLTAREEAELKRLLRKTLKIPETGRQA